MKNKKNTKNMTRTVNMRGTSTATNTVNTKNTKNMNNMQEPANLQAVKPIKFYQHLLIIGAILLLTVLIYSNSINNGFIGFDDPECVIDNILIRQITCANIVQYFTIVLQFMYAPLVLISYAIDYQIGQLNPAFYHFTNLLLHLLNVVLIYWIFQVITGRLPVSIFIATAFAIHPVFVDGIAWIGVRNNILYTLYLLGSVLSYIYYLKKGFNIKYLLLSVFCFVLSVFSKSTAVVLPPILFLLDYYYGRKWKWKLLVEKIPFLAIALAIGIITLHFRADIENRFDYTLFDRFLIICSSITVYLYKLLFPFNLSFAYAYPEKEGGFLPYYFYLAPFILGLIIWGIYKLKLSKKVATVGLAFFLINIVLNQAALLMDGYQSNRYAYLSYIGIFFILGDLNGQIFTFSRGWKSKIKNIWKAVLIVFIFIFALLTYNRISTWKDTMTLFDDVIKKQPNISFAYISRGLERLSRNDNEGALTDFTRAAGLESDSYLAYYYQGKARVALKDYQRALEDFSKALEIKNDYADIYYERANLKHDLGYNEAAIVDYNLSIQYKPEFSGAYNNRGNTKCDIKDYQGAISDYTKAVELDPYFAEAYNNRGSVKISLQDYQGALADYSKAIELKTGYADAYYNRGIAKSQLNDNSGACADWNKSLELGYQPAMDLIQQNCR